MPGEWYKVKVEVCGNRIRVFVNDEKLPHIDLEDKNSNLAPTGEVALGGGWIDTEFDDLTVTPLAEDALKDVKVQEYRMALTTQEKEKIRREERAQYTSVKLDKLTADRTELSLDGNWLFMPDYQLNDKTKAISMQTNDNDWQIMPVPAFWNLSVSGCMEKPCHRPPVRNIKGYRTLTTNKKPTDARTIRSTTGKPVLPGIANGWNCPPT